MKDDDKCKACPHVGYHLRTLDNLIRRNMIAEALSIGLNEVTVMHGWILSYLYDNREREIYQKDIENQFSINRSTVTNIVKLMEKKGLISREAVPQDARLKKLVLTQKGLWAKDAIYEVIKKTEQKVIEGISREELEAFFELIDRMRRNME